MRTIGYKLLKISIDEETLLRSNYTLAEFLILLLQSLEINPAKVQESLWHKGDLIKECFGYSMHPQGEERLKELIRLATPIEKANVEHFNRFESLANAMMNIFPEGRKPGTSHPWKGSITTVVSRLKTLISKHKASFTDEEAIEAARNYVTSFNGNYGYMRTLPYFIYKNERTEGGIEFKSDFLELIANKDSINTKNNDWANELV